MKDMRWIFVVIVLFIVSFLLIMLNLHKFLVTEESPEKVDAILVLSGGKGEREAEAAKLFHEGWSDKIIVTGALVGWETYSSDIMKRHLMALGVPKTAIYEYKEVTSTREEAEFAKPLLANLNVNSLILVTNKFHSSRAKWIFEKTLKDDQIKVISVPDREMPFDHNWWKNHETRKQGASEVLKYIWEVFRL